MQEDFYDAHDRHFEDAEFLYDDGRLATADNLYCISAECGIKALMKKYFISNTIPRDAKEHINKLGAYYQTFQSGHVCSQYPVDFSYFDDWDIANRYSNRNYFSQTIVDRHREGAQKINGVIWQAILDGGII